VRVTKHSTIAARALDRLDVTKSRSRTVTSESTVFGHVTASARFADALTHASSPPPVSPQSPDADVSQMPTFAGRRHKSVPLNTCQPTSRMLRATSRSGPHVAGFVAQYSYVPCHPFVLASSRVAYLHIIALAWPRPERNPFVIEIQIDLSPPLCIRVVAAASSITPVTNSQPCRWSHAGPSRTASPRPVSPEQLTRSALAFPLSHSPHALTSGSEDNNSRTPLPIHFCARSRLGNAAGLIILPIPPRTHT
jgi:hypothetical protein